VVHELGECARLILSEAPVLSLDPVLHSRPCQIVDFPGVAAAFDREFPSTWIMGYVDPLTLVFKSVSRNTNARVERVLVVAATIMVRCSPLLNGRPQFSLFPPRSLSSVRF